MTHLKLTIDDKVLMDGDLGQWRERPPTAIQHMIGPGKRPQPYLQAALMAVMEAAMTDTTTTIDVHTKPNGWNVDVTHLGPSEATK